MSLQVHDPRSRGRSKSPSGRSIRDRSTSHDSRGISPAPEVARKILKGYYEEDDSEDDLRSRHTSSSTGEKVQRSGSTRSRSRSKYDHDEEESWYRDSKDRYYLSDSGDDDVSRRPWESAEDRYGSESEDEEEYYRSHDRDRRHPDPRHDSYLPSDSDDEALAYGEPPPASTGTSSSGRYYKLSSSPPQPQPLLKEESSEQTPGIRPGYVKLDRFTYEHPTIPTPYMSGAQPPTLPADWAPIPECEMPGYVPPASLAQQGQSIPGPAIPGAFPPPGPGPQDTYAPNNFIPPPAGTHPIPPAPRYANVPPQQYVQAQFSGSQPPPPPPPTAYTPSHTQNTPSITVPQQYADLPQWQYANLDPGSIRYSSKPATAGSKPYTYQFLKPYTASSQPQFAEITPGGGGSSEVYSHSPPRPTTRPHSQSVSTGNSLSPGGGYGAEVRNEVPSATRPSRPHSLSVSSGNNPSVGGSQGPGARPPASPLLEPYHGTYQSISPMPSPMTRPSSRTDESISDLTSLDKTSESDSDSDRRKRHRRKDKSFKDDSDHDEEEGVKYYIEERSPRRERHDSQGSERPTMVLISPKASNQKRVSFYNPTPDAIALKEALSHHIHIDTKPLITILPYLTSDEILALRAEYKNHAKLHGKGINIAKHIKLKLGNGAFGKACYTTALGRWESEAYWANYYYQSSTSRRELLIESLIGRTNAEIREIKACFRDSRYAHNLEKCMKAELRADKFRMAILLALEGSRQDDREPIDVELVRRDVLDLRRALVATQGGETAMIHIIVLRSNTHLKEVLKVYDKIYGRNFAKEMIKKSRNLVVSIPFLSLSLLPTQALNCPVLRASISNSKRRAKPSHTSSTASSTAPCAMPSSSTKPSANPAPVVSARSCSSPASSVSTGSHGTWSTSRPST